jgi:hypothetical protein
MEQVAQRLLKQIADLEQKALNDQHYYKGCREGIVLLIQEMKKSANEHREREPEQKPSVPQVRKERKKADAGAD